MRKQQLALRALGLATALSIGTAYAGDGPEGSPAGKGGPPSAQGAHGKPGHARPDPSGLPAGRGPDKDRGPDKNGGPDKGRGPDSDAGPRRDLDGHGPRRPAMRELWLELKSGKLSKDELKKRIDELRARRDERAKEHRAELKSHFGAALAKPAAREELERHARRMAKLNRAMVLVETEVTKDKDKLKERIQKLIDKENARHQQAMDRFAESAAPASAASAASAAPPAPEPPVAEKGAEK